MSTLFDMKDSKTDAYVAGVICLIGTAIFIIVAINVGWDMTGQVLIVFGLVFGILGVGCFWKPELFGPIASQILKTMARNAEERNSRTYEQNQQESKNSPQIITKGDVTITTIYGQDHEKRKKRN